MKNTISLLLCLLLLMSCMQCAFADNSTIACPSCGKTIPADSKFCQYCGTKLVPTENQPASEKTYAIGEIGMSITIPDGDGVFTLSPDIKDGDPALSFAGYSSAAVAINTMKANNQYLDSYDQSSNTEIIITMADSAFNDYRTFSDLTLDTLASITISSYEEIGIEYLNREIYETDQAKYVLMYLRSKTESKDILQFNTSIAEKTVNITFSKYDAEMTEKDVAAAKAIVATAVYDAEPVTIEVEETEAFTYTDPLTKTSITIPANWREEALSQDRDTLDAKFISNDGNGYVLFGVTDLMEDSGLSEALRAELDIDNDSDEANEIATTFAGMMPAESWEIQTIGGTKYIILAVSVGELLGYSIDVNSTYAVTIKNGYYFLYQYYGDTESAHYSEFMEMLGNVNYFGVAKK